MKIYINGERKNITEKAAKVIRNQPGYRQREELALFKTESTGNIRLYCKINNNWMDASLEDITDKCIVSLVK